MTKPMRIYSDYFGIRENAFAITPDPRYLFMSERHREALAHLLFGTEEGGGFVQLTGEVGTGKTTICRAFLEQLPQNVDVALLLNPPDNGRELLLAIASELRLPVPRRDAVARELVELLNDRLLRAHAGGRRTVVIIDEAQNIRPEVLEQVRLLTNLETATHKLLQVFLIGQPELRQKLERPALRQVAQRITARYHLEPLSLPETRGYIRHRLAVAGCRQGLFSPAAVKQIYRQSQGIPRVINILCDRALIGAFATDMPEVNASIVRYAAREWRGENGRARLNTSLVRPAVALPLAGLMFVAVAGFAGSSTHPAGSLASLANAGALSVGNFVKQGWQQFETGASQPTAAAKADARVDTRSNTRSDTRSGAGDVAAEAGNRKAPLASSTSESGTAPLVPVERAKPTAVPLIVAVAEPQKAALVTGAVEHDRVPARSVVQAGAQVALQALLHSWGIRSGSVDRLALCDTVVRFGLRCLRETGSWDDLRAYNRPALLTLNREAGKEGYLTLVGMSDEEALVATGDGPRRVGYREMDAYWSGEFVVLWRPPLDGVSLIGENSADWALDWLQAALGRAEGGLSPHVPPKRSVEARLRAFQHSRGLAVDGIAGPRTLIHLNTLIGDHPFPLLMAHRDP